MQFLSRLAEKEAPINGDSLRIALGLGFLWEHLGFAGPGPFRQHPEVFGDKTAPRAFHGRDAGIYHPRNLLIGESLSCSE